MTRLTRAGRHGQSDGESYLRSQNWSWYWKRQTDHQWYCCYFRMLGWWTCYRSLPTQELSAVVSWKDEGGIDAINRDSKDLPPVVLLLAPKPPLFPNVLDEPPNWKLLLPPPPKAMMALVVEGQRNIEAEMSERDGRYSVERCRTRKNKRLSSGRSIAARW